MPESSIKLSCLPLAESNMTPNSSACDSSLVRNGSNQRGYDNERQRNRSNDYDDGERIKRTPVKYNNDEDKSLGDCYVPIINGGGYLLCRNDEDGDDGISCSVYWWRLTVGIAFVACVSYVSLWDGNVPLSALRRRHSEAASLRHDPTGEWESAAVISAARVSNHSDNESGGGVGAIAAVLESSRNHNRAFVCITGQLPRLELNEKISELLIPLYSEYSVEVDIALVLSDTDKRSVNRSGDRVQKYFAMTEIADALSGLPGITVLNHDIDVQSVNPVINMQYLEQRMARGNKMGTVRKVEEVKNHVRQFESLAKCHRHMVRSGRSYDLVHRIREDTAYYRPVNYTRILELTKEQPMTILTTDCTNHGGINDRGAFASPDAAYDYFNHPLMHMYTMPLPEDVGNTERFLLVTYERTCFVKMTDEFNLFKIWDAPNGTVEYLGEDLKCIKKMGL